MQKLLLCALFLALGVAGWAASGPVDGGFARLAATDSTPTETTTPTDTTVPTETTVPTDTTTPSTSTTTTTPVDNPPSFANVPASFAVEANGPGGSVVNYTKPTAVDDQDGPRPVTCDREPGSTFPVGQSTVTCTASDSGGQTAQATFTVTVRDTTPPTLVVPEPHSVYATSPVGVTDSDPAVIAFVRAARATDIVDPNPVLGTDLHSVLPVGQTVIRFFARDFSGNNTTRDVVLTVLPQPLPGAPPLPPPVVAAALVNVTTLSLTPLDGVLRITWQIPAGVDHVEVTRSANDDGAELVVYSGTAGSFADQGLQNGVEYRYVVRSVDAAGNRSAGVAIVGVPLRNMLRSPKDGAQLRKPPKLAWAREADADYYNLQLLRNGVRIFVSWPNKTTLTLKKTWKYQGRKYTLTPGRYQWYVWPGFGPRKDVNYGTLLGARSFQILIQPRGR